MHIDNVSSLQHRPAAYVLAGVSGDYLYKGSCRDLPKRLQDHRAGRVSRTKNRRPLRLVYFEYSDDYTAARRRETFFKSGAGRAWLKETLAAARNE
ncbi:MAG: GIY-YIG nuclease family protein [Lentisphaerae bacterium]|nr:GIY-YIG nuclease family protein [Lentisphaerota bacterium]